MDYNKKTEEIIALLAKAGETLAVKQMLNGQEMSLMPGERLSIICCILTTYKAGRFGWYELIREPAEAILNYAASLGRHPVPNFEFLEELSVK